MAILTFTKAGAKATTAAKLDKTVFEVVPSDHSLLKEAYLSYLANGRKNLAVTKTRGQIRGGGRKPWRQKGTGRARFGSSRNPIWRGGGIAFGPTGLENYTKHLSYKSKRLAIRQALSLANEAKKLMVIEAVTAKGGKTAELARLLAKIGAKGRTLLVVENKTDELTQSSQNLSDVKLVQSSYINVYDVLNADAVVITNGSLQLISDWLTPDAKPLAKPAKETSNE